MIGSAAAAARACWYASRVKLREFAMHREEKQAALKIVKSLVGGGKHREAFTMLRQIAEVEDDFSLQSRYARLFQSLDSELLELRPLRIALLGSSTLEHFADVLRYWLACEGFSLELYLAPYDTLQQTVLDEGSPLYAFKPDIIWLFSNQRDVRFGVEHGSFQGAVEQAVLEKVQEFSTLWQVMQSRCPAYIIQNNLELPAEREFGNFEGAVPWGRANLLRRFNLALSDALPTGVTLLDIEHISSLYGRQRWHDPRIWFHSKHSFCLDATGIVAFHASRLIGALKGTSKKCVILDLDNTLWGGVIGDDGLEGIQLGHFQEGQAYMAFQDYLSALRRRGILLAVCSKNEDEAARSPFLHHADMRLRLDDIAVFKASWNNKADTIREIAGLLNLGLDSMVFVDDNPAERELVRSLLPMVTVPEMPEDPAHYISALDRLRLFEAVSYSDEDRGRAQMYQQNAARDELRRTFSNLSEYLDSLDMEATVGPIDAAHLPRSAQLVNKSNQFHLTGVRFSESELQAKLLDPDYTARYFRLVDRFGDNGLISVVVLQRQPNVLFIHTWVMSCRVLSRGMEEFICREMLALARAEGCPVLRGLYVPSKKNKLVAGLYERLGFVNTEESPGGAYWEMQVEDEPPYEIHIRNSDATREALAP